MARATVNFLRSELAARRTTSSSLVDQALQAIEDRAGEGGSTFLRVFGDLARSQAAASDALRAAGVVRSPIEGLPVSVKDLFDVAGDVTRAGSKVLAGAAPAEVDAPAVARLRAAGAILIGRTNMVEFAYGATGLNPHYGTPRNPYDRASGGRIPGGSSSGAAVSVADGMCNMGLGSDTGGSVRIPAALCGVAGFKPTASRIPKEGVFPLSYTLDSIGPLANSVACCAIYDAILAGEEACQVVAAPPLPIAGLRLLVPQCVFFDTLDSEVSGAFDRSVRELEAAGARVERRDVPVLTEAHELLFKDGGVAAAEAYQIHRHLLRAHEAAYDRRVVMRVLPGGSRPAADYVQLMLDHRRLKQEVSVVLQQYDAMIYPTVASVAPTIAEVDETDESFSSWNLRLLRNTFVINALDGCAATVPCHRSGDAPVGLSVAGASGTDKRILAVAQAVEATLQQIAAAE